MTAQEIVTALRKKYSSPAYSVQAEVRNGTGGYGTRSMDVLVMALWPSRGLELLGFEIKVSRQDWLHELATPEKAEAFYEAVDLWYVITPPDLVQPGELPKSWGWMSVNGKGIKVQVPALNRRPIGRQSALPEGFNRIQLAGLLRRLDNDYLPRAVIQARTDQAMRDARESAHREVQHKLQDFAHLRERIAAYEKASGMSIANGWERVEDVGRAVRLVLDSGPERQRRQLREHIAFLRQQLKDAESYLEGS